MQLFGIKIVSAKHYNELELRIRNINKNLAELSTCVSDLMELEEARRKNKFSPKQRVEHRQAVDAKFRSLASNVGRLMQCAKFNLKQRAEYYQTVNAKFHSLASNIDRLQQDVK